MFKGYFYDEESGFYYLKSRYYNPEICRFISMDNINYLNIQWHPGSRHHFGGAPYWKVTSAVGGTWRGLYLF